MDNLSESLEIFMTTDSGWGVSSSKLTRLYVGSTALQNCETFTKITRRPDPWWRDGPLQYLGPHKAYGRCGGSPTLFVWSICLTPTLSKDLVRTLRGENVIFFQNTQRLPKKPPNPVFYHKWGEISTKNFWTICNIYARNSLV